MVAEPGIDPRDPGAVDPPIGSLLLPGGSGDPSDEFWLNHLRAGLLLFMGATVLAAVYLVRTPDGDNRGLAWAMVVVSLLATAAVVAMPRRSISSSPRRMVFFVAWSTFSCLFTGVVAAVDGGLSSPLALFVFIPITYASLAYPAGAVIGIGTVGALSAVGAAITAGDTFAHTAVFVGTTAMVTLLCASVTRARREQQRARQELTEQLIELATRDGLTGCLNHRSFYEAVDHELARSARYGHDVSLLVIDVDHFKSINDRLGHLAGDDVLRLIGSTLRSVGRATDLVGRIGGDEFAVLMPETGTTQVAEAAARLQAGVGALDAPVPTSVTVGVATLAAPIVDATAHRLVAIADAQLYERKHRAPGCEDPVPGAQPPR
jgi:diguanylate cyclase (GGDEF)-like protein